MTEVVLDLGLTEEFDRWRQKKSVFYHLKVCGVIHKYDVFYGRE